MTAGAGADPVVSELRDLITAIDERVLDDLNERLQLVAELREKKIERGLPFLDPDREASLLAHLKEKNAGPLSDAGVERLVGFVLQLVKDELSG